MPSRDVNAATRLAEASWRRNNNCTHKESSVIELESSVIE